MWANKGTKKSFVFPFCLNLLASQFFFTQHFLFILVQWIIFFKTFFLHFSSSSYLAFCVWPQWQISKTILVSCVLCESISNIKHSLSSYSRELFLIDWIDCWINNRKIVSPTAVAATVFLSLLSIAVPTASKKNFRLLFFSYISFKSEINWKIK